MQHTVEEIISQQKIAQRITELGQAISEHYRYSSKIMMIGLLRGSFIFIADLCRAVSLSHEVDFITISSYGNKIKTDYDIKIIKDLADNIYDKDVIIVEDIIDSGNTIRRISELLTLRHPKSIAICSLLDKPKRRQFNVIVDWVGFTISDDFVVGYGIDYAQQYRNLPYIGKIVAAKI